jgi:lipopolysaccharide transport protein LptA
MRNFTRRHHKFADNAAALQQSRLVYRGQNPALLMTLLVMILLMVPQPCISGDDQGFRLGREDVVSIQADKAWEDITPDTVYFEGHFQMQVRDWVVLADRAVLLGKLDDPDHLELEGSPARMELSYKLGQRTEILRGEASKILYDRQAAKISLSGDARMVQDDKILQSSEIDYDIDTDRFRTLGETGINISIDSKKQEP